MSYTRFNRRGVKQALDGAAKNVMSDLAQIAATSIARDAPRDSLFLVETIEAIGVDGEGQAARHEQRQSLKSGQLVTRESRKAPALPPDTAAVHVGAVYAMDAELRDPFIWPSIEALSAALPSVIAKRRV